jgi:hypothetical protein
MDKLELMSWVVRCARLMLADDVKPRDDTECAIVNALGECSWDECVIAIQRYRAEQGPTPEAHE